VIAPDVDGEAWAVVDVDASAVGAPGDATAEATAIVGATEAVGALVAGAADGPTGLGLGVAAEVPQAPRQATNPASVRRRAIVVRSRRGRCTGERYATDDVGWFGRA
jgi:hypothetical protein